MQRFVQVLPGMPSNSFTSSSDSVRAEPVQRDRNGPVSPNNTGAVRLQRKCNETTTNPQRSYNQTPGKRCYTTAKLASCLAFARVATLNPFFAQDLPECWKLADPAIVSSLRRSPQDAEKFAGRGMSPFAPRKHVPRGVTALLSQSERRQAKKTRINQDKTKSLADGVPRGYLRPS